MLELYDSMQIDMTVHRLGDAVRFVIRDFDAGEREMTLTHETTAALLEFLKDVLS
jgi:hypothetical protein